MTLFHWLQSLVKDWALLKQAVKVVKGDEPLEDKLKELAELEAQEKAAREEKNGA